jgi:hypothetical protein
MIRDEALVLNQSNTAIALQLYAADGDTAVNGGTTFADEGRDSTGVRHWLSTDVASVHLDPGQSTTVPFTLTVPADIAPGDWVAGWVVEAPPKAAPGGLDVSVIERAGVAVVVHIPGPAAPGLVLGAACFNGKAGSAYFQVDVQNPGNVLNRGQGTFTLLSDGGVIIFEQPADLGAVIPGDDTVLRIDSTGEIPARSYEAVTEITQPSGQKATSTSPVEVRANDNSCRDGAVAGEEQGPKPPLIPGLPGGGGFPWLILILALIAAIIAAAGAREYLRRRRRSRPV